MTRLLLRASLRDLSAAGGLTNEFFVYDGDELSMTFGHTGQLEHRYLHGPADQVLVDEVFKTVGSQQVSDEVLWLVGDHQGTPRDIVNDNGMLRKHIDYSSFGRVIDEQFYAKNGTSITASHAEAVEQLFGYTGQERDSATGLQKHGVRWYDPFTGRWRSTDPSGLGPDANLYRYVHNSPVIYVDPTGLIQAGNPLNSLNIQNGGYSGGKVAAHKPVSTAVASGFSTVKAVDQYFLNQQTSISNLANPSPLSGGLSSFVGPTSQQILNAQLNPHGRPVGVEYVGGGPAGDVFRNVPQRLTQIANTTSSPTVAFVAKLGANLSKPTSYLAGGLTDAAFTPSEPDVVVTYRDGTKIVTPGVPTTGALANTAAFYATPLLAGASRPAGTLTLRPAPNAPSVITAGSVAKTAPGKNFIPVTHVEAAAAEFNLIQSVQRQGDVILKVNTTVTQNGADLVTYNPQTGQVTLWDSKTTIGRLNSGGQRVPQNIAPSTTLTNRKTLNKALAEAERAIQASNLSPADQAKALQSIQNDTFRKVTAGAGNANNSVIQYGR